MAFILRPQAFAAALPFTRDLRLPLDALLLRDGEALRFDFLRNFRTPRRTAEAPEMMFRTAAGIWFQPC